MTGEFRAPSAELAVLGFGRRYAYGGLDVHVQRLHEYNRSAG